MKSANSDPIQDAAQSSGIPQDKLLEMMRVLGAELRRPDPETEQKRLEEKLRTKLAKEHERQVITEQAEKVRLNQEACGRNGHRMDGGRSNRTAISGQVHSDGLFHGICVACLWTFTRKPSSDEMSFGVLS
jgi:hypothetical protein